MTATISAPVARDLEVQYRLFGDPDKPGRKPCLRGTHGHHGHVVHNQCAVRLGVALSRCLKQSIFDGYLGHDLHSAACCASPNPYPHISSASGIYKHLHRTLQFHFVHIKAATEIQGKKGILFFEGVYKRDNGSAGDHIDFWDGRTYTNQATGTGAPRGKLTMFGNAASIRFCEL